MPTQLTKTIKRVTDVTFEGQPLVITVNPDMTVDIAVQRRSTTALKLNLVDMYLQSRFLDGKQGHSRKDFVRNDKIITAVARPTKQQLKDAAAEPAAPEALDIQEAAPVADDRQLPLF